MSVKGYCSNEIPLSGRLGKKKLTYKDLLSDGGSVPIYSVRPYVGSRKLVKAPEIIWRNRK